MSELPELDPINRKDLTALIGIASGIVTAATIKTNITFEAQSEESVMRSDNVRHPRPSENQNLFNNTYSITANRKKSL